MSNINIAEAFNEFPIGTSTPYAGLDWTISGCTNIIKQFPGTANNALKLTTSFQAWLGAVYQDYTEQGSYTDVSADFSLLNNEMVGICSRMTQFNPNGSQPDTGYSLDYFSDGPNVGKAFLHKGPGNTVLGSVAVAVGASFNLRLVCSNNAVTGYVDGKLVLGPYIDSTYIGGFCGVRAWSGTIFFTNFNILGAVPSIGAITPAQPEPIVEDLNLVQMADYVSVKLNGVPAQSEGVRPNKQDIINEINKIQQQICNERDWLFLRGICQVPGFSISTTDTVTQTLSTPTQAATYPIFSAPGTNYKAAQLITVGSKPFLPTSVTVGLAVGTGLGAPSGTATVSLMTWDASDTTGPNLAKRLLITSASIDLGTLQMPPTVPPYSNIPVTFTFANPPTIFFKEGTKYWIVLEINCAPDMGAQILPAFAVGTPTTNNGSWFLLLPNPTWTTALTAWGNTAPQLYYSITGPQATYINEDVPLPAYITHAYRMFSGEETDGFINMLPYSDDRLVANPSQLPMDRFVVQRQTNGHQVVLFRPPSFNVPYWKLEFKSKGTKLIKDSDVSILPSEYRYMICDKVLLNFWSLGFGQQDGSAAQMLNSDIGDMLKSMRREYLMHPVKGFRVNRGGGVSQLPLPLDLPNRIWVASNVPCYYRATTSGA